MNMAKKKTKEPVKETDTVKKAKASAIETALTALKKKHGEEVVNWMSAVPSAAHRIVPTGSMSLDAALGVGGIVRGRIYELYGPNACLDSDTFIPYRVISEDGRLQSKKGGTIQRLYERFHGIERKGKGYYQRPQTLDSEFYTLSVDKEGLVFVNKIVDVFSTGEKECFEVRTVSGALLTATKDHKFFTGDKYVPLERLKVGSRLMLHNNTWNKYSKESSSISKDYRTYWYVKEHPVAREKQISSNSSEKVYTYKRLVQARAIIEADMNNLSPLEYRNRLNDGNLKGLTFLPRSLHVHHLDEDFTNDALSNLVVVEPSAHGDLHSHEKDFGTVVVEDFVKSIDYVGLRNTFDIKMDFPHNNYIANGLVVHNSGKTTLALSLMLEAQKMGLKSIIVDAEHTLSEDLLTKMGVNLKEVMLIHGYTAEQNLDIAEALMATGEFALCIIDSISALQPSAEANLESFSNNTMGLHPRLMSRMCRSFTPLASRTKTALILINQIRANMSGYGNAETTSGGNAIQHHVSGRIRVYGGGIKSRQIKNLDSGEVIGHRILFEVTKNKLAAPFRTAEVDLIYGKGFHTDGEILDLAVDMGLVNQAGAWFSIGEEKLGQGRTKAVQAVEDNKELKKRLVKDIRAILGLKADE